MPHSESEKFIKITSLYHFFVDTGLFLETWFVSYGLWNKFRSAVRIG